MGRLIAIAQLISHPARLGKALWLLAAIGLLTIMPGAAADESPVLDYQVKAAMLYKFLSYTDWPDSAFANPQTPYRICVLGSTLMAQELHTLVDGRKVNGRGIEVSRVDNLAQMQQPHVVFVSADMERYLAPLAQSARQEAFLVVTENNTGLRPGSTINLRLIEGRVGFDVSLPSAQKYRLKLSSRLLAVAATVDDRGRR